MAPTVTDGLIALSLVLWLGASIAAQFHPRWLGRVARRDHFGLLPRWNFFAPLPGDADPRLVFRDRLEHGEFTDWQELPVAAARAPFAFIWNPSARGRKALFDISVQLQLLKRRRPETICLSIPYLLLLNFVCSPPPPAGASHREFLLVESRAGAAAAWQPLRIALRSDLHALGDDEALAEDDL